MPEPWDVTPEEAKRFADQIEAENERLDEADAWLFRWQLAAMEIEEAGIVPLPPQLSFQPSAIYIDHRAATVRSDLKEAAGSKPVPEEEIALPPSWFGDRPVKLHFVKSRIGRWQVYCTATRDELLLQFWGKSGFPLGAPISVGPTAIDIPADDISLVARVEVLPVP